MINKLLILLLIIPIYAKATLKININRGYAGKTSIDVANCQKEAKSIANIIKSDLNSTGIFKLEDVKDAKCSKNASLLSSYSDLRSDLILIVSLVSEEDDEIEVKYRLIDSKIKKQLVGKSLLSKNFNYRSVAHTISDAIYNKITGDMGYFNTKIAHIAEINGAKKLAIMDQDTANLQFFTDGKSLVLTPRFSPDGSEIIYMSYKKKQGKVYAKNLKNNNDKIVGKFSGLVSAPRFSPDGQSALIARSTGKFTDIHCINLKNGYEKKLTSRTSINTSPCYSPDQKRIVFNSDRSGSLQIYTMNADGTNQKRISYGSGSYATPVWSPRGDLIAFTKIYKGGFYIGVMHPDGKAERILTTGHMVEGPSWSPNGRLIIFTREEKSIGGKKPKSRIYSIDITGKNERQIKTNYNASGASWS